MAGEGRTILAAHENRKQFQTLDGLRGVAALIVVMWHGDTLFGGLRPMSGYLAVDLFFGLSGFVISHAYGARLTEGLSAARFMGLRLIRLYPLYILGIGLAAAYDVAGLAMGSPLNPASWYLSSAAMAPAPPSAQSQILYPMNPPAWSLFFELLSNLGLALAPVMILRIRNLLIIVAVAIAALAAQSAIAGDLHGGSMWPTVWGGLPRVAVSFALGALIYRWSPRLRFKPPAALLLAIAAALLFVDAPDALRPWYDFLVVVLVWPSILVCAVNAEPSARLQPTFAWLGMVSYAVYALHFPIIVAITGVLRRLAPRLLADAPLAVGVICLVASLLAAWIADIVYDQPVRRALTRWAARPRARDADAAQES